MLRRLVLFGGFYYKFGFFAPQFWQNFPLFIVPQEHIQRSSTGLGAPHSEQNLPVAMAPQEHLQELAAD